MVLQRESAALRKADQLLKKEREAREDLDRSVNRERTTQLHLEETVKAEHAARVARDQALVAKLEAEADRDAARNAGWQALEQREKALAARQEAERLRRQWEEMFAVLKKDELRLVRETLNAGLPDLALINANHRLAAAQAAWQLQSSSAALEDLSQALRGLYETKVSSSKYA